VITEPLLQQWRQTRNIIATGADKGPKTKARKDGDAAWQEFTANLQSFRVLDPACGSGNFLYLALEALRDVERRVFRDANELAGYQQGLWLLTGPHNILGIEINDTPPSWPGQRCGSAISSGGGATPADQQQTDPQPARRHRTPRRPA